MTENTNTVKQLKISCHCCGQKLNVTDLEPFSHINCPICNTDLIIPKWFDNYLLEEPGGIGGMAVVYRALDIALDREVAIKVLKEELAKDADRSDLFLREARTAATINHYAVVPIYTCGTATNNNPYIVMQYMSGGSLELRLSLAKGNLPVRDVIQWMKNTAEGLENAHQNGIVHHDIKPGNILLDSERNAKLGDFGIAQVVKCDERQNEILRNCLSPLYVSPEKVRTRDEDYRGDIYSLGATMYHLLTGKTPFSHPEIEELLQMRLTTDPAAPDTIRPEIGKKASDLTIAMMNREPEKRPEYPEIISKLNEILQDIDKAAVKPAIHQAKPVAAVNKKPVKKAAPPPAPVKSSGTAASSVFMLASLLLLLAGSGIFLWKGHYLDSFFGIEEESAESVNTIDSTTADILTALAKGNASAACTFIEGLLKKSDIPVKSKLKMLELYGYAVFLNGQPDANTQFDTVLKNSVPEIEKNQEYQKLKFLSGILSGENDMSGNNIPEKLRFEASFARLLHLVYASSMQNALKPAERKSIAAFFSGMKDQYKNRRTFASEIFEGRLEYWQQVLVTNTGVKKEVEPAFAKHITEEKPWAFTPKTASQLFDELQKGKAASPAESAPKSSPADNISETSLDKLFERTKSQGRPTPKAAVKLFTMKCPAYVSALTPDKAKEETRRYKLMNEIQAYIISMGMRNPYPVEYFRDLNGKKYNNGELKFSKENIDFLDGKKRIALSWDDLPASEISKILKYYATDRERRLTQAKEMKNKNFTKELVWAYARYALCCAWYGDYKEAEQTITHIKEIMPGPKTNAFLEHLFLR